MMGRNDLPGPRPATWGSDEAGLICAYGFSRGLPPRELDAAQAAQAIARIRGASSPDDGFIWLHLNLGHSGALRWLERHAAVPSAFLSALQDKLRTTRVERDEDTLIAVVNDIRFDFSFDADDVSTLWISLESHLAVTVRLTPLRSVDQIRSRVRTGEPLRSTVDLLEHLLRAQADVLLGIVRDVSRRVDDIEDTLLAGRPGARRARLGAMRRTLVRLRRLLAPEPASMFRLLQHPPAWIHEHDTQELRQASEEFSVVLSDLATLLERIRLLQEEVAAAVNESNNRSLFVLTVLTVLALPINLTSGLFGMNVGGVPLNQHPQGFWIVVACVSALTALAVWLAFRRRDDD